MGVADRGRGACLQPLVWVGADAARILRWRIGDASDHVWQAPASAEGSAAAWEVFRTLSRKARAHHVWPRSLLILTIAATLVFLASQAVYSLTSLSLDPGQERSRLLEWAGVVDAIAYAVMLSGLVVLAAWFLAERLKER